MTCAADLRKQSKRQARRSRLASLVEVRKIYTMASFDIPDVVWVERFVVGISHPDQFLTQSEIDKQMTSVNRALRYGKIISVEQNFTVLSVQGKDILTQYTVYHVGFKQRPPGC